VYEYASAILVVSTHHWARVASNHHSKCISQTRKLHHEAEAELIEKSSGRSAVIRGPDLSPWLSR